VMAVPGPVRSPASCYTNELLVSGSPPARDVDDVLVALDLLGRGPARRGSARSASSEVAPPPDDPHQAALLEALGWQPANLDQLVVRTGLSPGQASVALARLEVGGRVVGEAGWWEQVRQEAPAK
jgi:DNA processing protein